MQHSAYTASVDHHMSKTSTVAEMVTEFTQKAERMETPNAPRRNMNHGQTGRSNGKKGSNAAKDKSKWWVDPDTWANWSSEQRHGHLQKKKAALAQQKKDKQKNKSSSSDAVTPVPSSNYGSQVQQLQSLLQYASMSDTQRAQLQQLSSNMHLLQQLQHQNCPCTSEQCHHHSSLYFQFWLW